MEKPGNGKTIAAVIAGPAHYQDPGQIKAAAHQLFIYGQSGPLHQYNGGHPEFIYGISVAPLHLFRIHKVSHLITSCFLSLTQIYAPRQNPVLIRTPSFSISYYGRVHIC